MGWVASEGTLPSMRFDLGQTLRRISIVRQEPHHGFRSCGCYTVLHLIQLDDEPQGARQIVHPSASVMRITGVTS